MAYSAWIPLSAFITVLLSVWWLSSSRFSSLALDQPNPRSLHETPVPRTGGIGVHLGILAAWSIIAPNLPWHALFAFVLLLVISFIEDVRGVPVVLRLAAHLLAASLLTAGVVPEEFGVVAMVVGTLAVAWMTNLYNFMDGSDGLAGGMASFGFSFYGVAALLAGDTTLALLCFSVAAAATAFLVFNFHPARIFLGDVGSVPLGFLAGALGLSGWAQHHWPWWFPLLVFSPFLVDASVTLARRLMRGERIWQAHREHIYQRLVQMGWGHRNTAIAEYALMLASGLVALIGLTGPTNVQPAVLIAAAACYAGLIAFVERAWHRFIREAAR